MEIYSDKVLLSSIFAKILFLQMLLHREHINSVKGINLDLFGINCEVQCTSQSKEDGTKGVRGPLSVVSCIGFVLKKREGLKLAGNDGRNRGGGVGINCKDHSRRGKKCEVGGWILVPLGRQ